MTNPTSSGSPQVSQDQGGTTSRESGQDSRSPYFDIFQYHGTITRKTITETGSYIDHGPLWNARVGDWIRWHPIINAPNHHVVDPLPDLKLLSWMEELIIEEVLQAITSFASPATGRIYIKYRTEQRDKYFVNEEYFVNESGFLVENNLGDIFFITCTQFLKRSLSPTQRQEVFTLLASKGSSAECMITTDAVSPQQKISLDDAPSAILWNIDPGADIAIFRVVDTPIKSRQDMKAVTVKDLYALPTDYSGPIFSIAYAGPNPKLESVPGHDIISQFEEDSPHELGFLEELKNENGKYYTIYDFIQDRYLQRTLRDNDVGIRGIRHVKAGKPAFDEVFKSHLKSIAAGAIKEVPAESKEVDSSHTRRDFLPERIHNMSTWYGCEGGMVGIPRKDPRYNPDLGKTEPVIVGLLKGGKPAFSGTNVFLAFTAQSIAWIDEVINSPAVSPDRFGAMDLMHRHAATGDCSIELEMPSKRNWLDGLPLNAPS